VRAAWETKRRLGRRGIGLLRVRAREARERGGGIVAARGGEAPRTDRGADQVAHARLGRQPLAEDRPVEARDAQSLGSARGAGHDLHHRRIEALGADACGGARAGADREDRIWHARIIP
jgi:hypothetical protein